MLTKRTPGASKIPVKQVATFLKDNSLALLASDKEGGFLVLPVDLYKSKALVAISSVFLPKDSVSLTRQKSEAKKLCKRLNLEQLVRKLDAGKQLSLELFFVAKTHKVDCTLRVIVSEAGTWQKSVALFLQKSLKLFQIHDPFLVKSSDNVISFLKDSQRTSFMACSFDIKYLYYSLPHNGLLTCIRDCIDVFGAVAFQNAAGLSVEAFMELVDMHLCLCNLCDLGG